MLLRFGPNELNPSNFELRRSRRRIRLAMRPMELLLLLVERRGELLTREEIARSLWPGMDVEDLGARINTAIAQIRGALDDDASRPRYLETVIGKGYRFIGVVEEVRVSELVAAGQGHEAQVAAQTTQPEEPIAPLSPGTPEEALPSQPLPTATLATSRLSWRRAVPVLLTVALALLALTLAMHFYSRNARPGATPAESWSDLPVTQNDSDVPISTAALSPDGSVVAYGDPAGIFLENLTTGETRRVLSPPLRVIRLAWYPKQDRLLATGYADGQSHPQIWILSADGAAPRLFRQSGKDGVPSPNGANIAFLTDDGREIRIADGSGTGEQTIAKAAAADTYSGLFWSANSQRISYQQRSLSPNGSVEMESNFEWTYGSRDIATGTQTAFLANLAFDSAQESSDGRMFYLRSRAGGDLNNRGIWVARTDPATGRLLDAPQRLCAIPYVVLSGMTVTANGQQVAATREAWQPDIYIGELNSPITALHQVKRLTSDLRSDFPHSWDFKSQAVYFESNRSADGRFHLFRQSVDNPIAEALTSGAESQIFPQLTADGKTLVYEQRQDGASTARSIRRANPDGSDSALVWKEGDLDEWRCPPRGESGCVLRQTRQHEQFVFYRLDLATGKGQELARCAWMPTVLGDWALSLDGSEAALPSHEKKSPSILLVPLNGKGAPHTLKVNQDSQLWGLHWSADGSGFFAEARTDAAHQLEFIDREGNVHPLRVTQGNTWGIPSPDGKKLAYIDSTTTRNVFIWQK